MSELWFSVDSAHGLQGSISKLGSLAKGFHRHAEGFSTYFFLLSEYITTWYSEKSEEENFPFLPGITRASRVEQAPEELCNTSHFSLGHILCCGRPFCFSLWLGGLGYRESTTCDALTGKQAA